MTLILVGLNHRTAPVELREKLALSDSALKMAYLNLKTLVQSDTTPVINGVVILSTCNRLEIYFDADQPDVATAAIEQFLSREQHIASDILAAHLYSYQGDEAINHLMRVASGIDSMILGEAQILGQVTQAYESAHQANAAGPILSHLFAQAIHTGKRARTETPISRYTTSVSHAAGQLLLEQFNQRRDVHVLVIGAGEMASLAAQALKRLDIHDLAFVNRTYEHAASLAAEFGGRALSWSQLGEGLSWADAVITATNAPHTILSKHDIETLSQPQDLVIIDIAVPRDVDEDIRELSTARYYDIDDLQSVVDNNQALRRAAIPRVEKIITQEMTRFSEWHRGREVTPVIKDLRQWAEGIADEELEQTLNRLADADERTRQLVSRMAHRLVNRLLHEPTARLQVQANEGNGYGYAYAVRELFALDDAHEQECQRDGVHCPIVEQGLPVSRACNLQCIVPTSMP